jgi:hypothetical protein
MGSAATPGPIYIGGLDRCGKTTMQALLASHPNISIPAVGSNMETYFYARYGDLRRPRNLERCLRAMLSYKHVRFLEPDVDRIRREFADGPPTYWQLFSLFLRHHAEREGKPRWGAQTGLVERYADELLSAFPGMRIIHMVRDPRDRYEASLARWPDGRGRAGGATARFRYSTALAERHRRRHPGSYLVVRFEDLILRTGDVVRQVCDFVGEEYRPELLAMDGAPRHRDRLRAGAGGGEGILSADHIGRHRGRVPDRELAFIQLHAGRAMRSHGYRPEPIHLGPAGRLRFGLVDWPNQAARMVAWRLVEEGQQRFPRVVPRRPGERMIVDQSYRPADPVGVGR